MSILVCGNGGSASDGAHFAAELACRFVSDRRPYPAISLTGDGGFCRGLADLELLIPEQVTARIQEAHKVIIHLLCELVEPDLAKE
jgi:phosphoheptose isomerase